MTPAPLPSTLVELAAALDLSLTFEHTTCGHLALMACARTYDRRGIVGVALAPAGGFIIASGRDDGDAITTAIERVERTSSLDLIEQRTALSDRMTTALSRLYASRTMTRAHARGGVS